VSNFAADLRPGSSSKYRQKAGWKPTIGTMNPKTRRMIGVIGLILLALGLSLGFAFIGLHLIQGMHLVIE
jgi:hypothetical protein